MIRLKYLIIILSLNFLSVLSGCPSTFFDCGNDRCIAQFWRCDGEDDCGNWADEHNCQTNLETKPIVKECPINHTHCNDTHNTCVPNKWVCDGMEDCGNGSDEMNCTIESAHCVGFLCHNFECIPSRWRCDGIPDCEDVSDEFNCTKPKKNQNCDKEHGFYQCLTGECIPHIKVCDNHKDCPQGDDEGIECRPTGCHLKNCSQSCFVAPHGPQCYCREGFVIGLDNITCIDRDECALNKENGLCSQKCINTDGSYKCMCIDGYQMVNNKSCVVKDGEPLLLFSNSEGIRGLWLQTHRYFPIYHTSKQTVGIDVFGAEEKIFWVELDKVQSGVYSVDITGNNFEPIITTGLKSPEDLAIDWIGENIYITDAELNKIIVCHLDGSICASLTSNNLDLPRGIVVDPHQGILFWSEWGKFAGIYQSGMDGSNQITLINENIVWPNGLAFDNILNRLYWTEAKRGSIEFYDFDTKLRKPLLKDTVFHPFSLSVFEDSLYWSDWITYSLDSSNKMNGHNQTTLIREINEHIMGVQVYHPILQKLSYNPCWLNRCSHLCLLAPLRQYSCVCPDHMVLSDDNETCIANQSTPFLLLGVEKTIKKVYSESIGKDVMIDVRIPNGIKVGDIAYNWKTQTLYVFNLNKLSIGSIQLQNPINAYWVPLIDSQLDRVEGLTYDIYTNNLYWLETKEGILEVATVDGKARAVLIDKLDKPIDLVLYPEHRRMYIAVMGSKPHIMVSDMDGQNQKVLIESKNGLAVSLAIDKLNKKLFWADAKNGIIEWIQLFAPKDSDLHKGVIKRNIGHVMSIAILNDILYWTDIDSDILYHETIFNRTSRVYEIPLDISHRSSSEKKLFVALPEEEPIDTCAKSKGGCSHICLLGRFGQVCKCPFGYKLESDEQTCVKQNDMSNGVFCKDCVTSDYQQFQEELGFNYFENSDEEDLNWFENEDQEADELFALHDSKHKIINITEEVVTHEVMTTESIKVENKSQKMIIHIKEQNLNETKVNKNKVSVKVNKKKENKVLPQNEIEEKVKPVFKEAESKSSDSHHNRWLTAFVVILIIALIILLLTLILRKDNYRDVRNVIYKRGDQIRGAIVSFQNPIYKKQFKSNNNDEEEPLNEETAEEKY